MLSREEIRRLAGDAGLSSAQVPEMRRKFGANRLTPPVREPLWRAYLKNYDNPIIKILIVAVVISAAVALIQGHPFYDTAGIMIAIFLATGISFFNEYRSSREFEALNAHRDETAVTLVRDGHPTAVPARDIVVGDLILIEAGDAVPADGWISASDNLFTDESAFTGETEPVPKEAEATVLRGTLATAGKGSMIAAAVGDAAQMGVIAASLGIDHATPTPLEEKLERLAHLISRFGYAMAVLILGTLLVRGIMIGELTGPNLATANHILGYFMIAVVIIVVAVPEGLPMSVALSLSLAMRKMTRANCLVRRLIACETIGSATTVCTDKTGTLTKNQMEVQASPAGAPEPPGDPPQTPAQWITLNAAVNGTAHLGERDGRVIVLGNSTEGALLRWLLVHRIDYMRIRAGNVVRRQYLFDGVRKRMSTVVSMGGREYLLVKGAPEILASLCTDPPDLGGVGALASRAMRTLAFAHKEIIGGDESEARLRWDGYVGIRDMLRDRIRESVSCCQRAGIRVRMVTGDDPGTARAIAGETGILTGGTVITGKEFRELPGDRQEAAAEELDVMARAEPMDKLQLVNALQRRGAVVAVTGDGTNDAPALKHADVGLSMGIAGTEVAREASDIILLDDSFASITNAVRWGRSLYENIQRFLLFQLTINFSACILVFLATVLGYPEPFTILQILWINLIMDTLAAFALCSEAPHRGLMSHPPIPRDERIITPFMGASIIVTSGFFIGAGFLQMTTGFLGGVTPAGMSTVFFTAFVCAQVWNGINCRAMDGRMPPFFRGNPVFFGVMALVIAGQVAIVQYGGPVFGTVPLSAAEWAGIVILSASVLVPGYIVRTMFRRKKSGIPD
jgi:Ca2+-transporting ATPase